MSKRTKGSAYTVRSKGKVYVYAWRGKRAPRISSAPGTAGFYSEMANALSGTEDKPQKNRIHDLVTQYRQSASFNNLRASTQIQYNRWLDRIREYWGDLEILQFGRPKIRTEIDHWRDRWLKQPRTADFALQVLSSLLGYATEKGIISSNPCRGLKHRYKVNRADIIWKDADIAKLVHFASPEVI